MLHLLFSLFLLFLAVLPALMVFANMRDFRKATEGTSPSSDKTYPLVSVLIPARNEEASIDRALRSIMSQSYPNLEVHVLDDHSTDRTAEIVNELKSNHPNLSLASSSELPKGWNGKQYACWQLANRCSGDYLLFLDADVRLNQEAVLRIVETQQQLGVDLLSGFPKQETGTISERLLIPLMYLMLLAYLPLKRSRSDKRASMAAGCGQLFCAAREAYFRIGGHEAIKSSRHDGLLLPRAFRARGTTTDLFDASDLATCRMYHNVVEVQRGLLKNATEGVASKALIVPFSVLLLGGFVLPLAMLMHGIFWQWDTTSIAILAVATVVSFLPRMMIASRLEDGFLAAMLNPIAVAWFVALQWIARIRHSLGIQTQWRGRQS